MSPCSILFLKKKQFPLFFCHFNKIVFISRHLCSFSDFRHGIVLQNSPFQRKLLLNRINLLVILLRIQCFFSMCLLSLWGLLFIFSLRVKNNCYFEAADKCVTYWWGSLMTQSINLKQKSWTVLPQTPDVWITLQWAIFSNSLTVLQPDLICY